MFDPYLTLYFLLDCQYRMTAKEKLMSRVREETYQLYREEKEALRYLRQKVRNLC